MINDKYISVVVQGPVDEGGLASRCLESVRKYLPNAEVILSTWEGSNLSNLEYDKLVLNCDPGAADCGNKPNNMNRMILSTKSGFAKASRKYMLKLRSDLEIIGTGFLNEFKRASKFKRISKFKLFKKRILSYQMFSLKFQNRHEGKIHFRPFHMSDWCYFGLKDDLQKLYCAAHIVKEPQFSVYYQDVMGGGDEIQKLRIPRHWKMSPEQYVTSSCAKNFFTQIKFDNMMDTTQENIAASELFIVNNFRILDRFQFAIINNKEQFKDYDITKNRVNRNGYYSEAMWNRDYNKYILGKETG
jgi:hypothetical protein